MKYTQEKKSAAIARMAEIGVQTTSEEMSISVQTLYKWRNEEGSSAEVPAPVPTISDDLKQLIANDRSLEKKIKSLEEENGGLRDEIKGLREANMKMKKAIIALLD